MESVPVKATQNTDQCFALIYGVVMAFDKSRTMITPDLALRFQVLCNPCGTALSFDQWVNDIVDYLRDFKSSDALTEFSIDLSSLLKKIAGESLFSLKYKMFSAIASTESFEKKICLLKLATDYLTNSSPENLANFIMEAAKKYPITTPNTFIFGTNTMKALMKLLSDAEVSVVMSAINDHSQYTVQKQSAFASLFGGSFVFAKKIAPKGQEVEMSPRLVTY